MKKLSITNIQKINARPVEKFSGGMMYTIFNSNGDPGPQEFPSPFQEPSIQPVSPEISPMPAAPMEPKPIEISPFQEPGEKPIPDDVPPTKEPTPEKEPPTKEPVDRLNY